MVNIEFTFVCVHVLLYIFRPNKHSFLKSCSTTNAIFISFVKRNKIRRSESFETFQPNLTFILNLFFYTKCMFLEKEKLLKKKFNKNNFLILLLQNNINNIIFAIFSIFIFFKWIFLTRKICFIKKEMNYIFQSNFLNKNLFKFN